MGNPLIDVEFAKPSSEQFKKWWQIPLYMYFCSFSVNIMVISLGMNIAWFSPAFGKLVSNDTNINPLGAPITTLQISMFASFPFLIPIVTNGLCAKSLDQIGRKTTIRLISFISICSLIVTAFATNIYVLFASLAVTAICVNGSVVSSSVYNNDIADDSNRGKLGCLMTLNIPIGIVICYFCGSLMSIQNLSLICALPALIVFLLTPFICESPVFLVETFRIAEAIETLEKLKQTKNKAYIEQEIKKIKDNIQVMSLCKQRRFVDVFKNRATRKALLLAYQLFLIEQFSGISPVLAFVGPIFSSAGIGLSGDTVGILIGLTKLLATLIALCSIDQIGRRYLLLFSSISSSIPLLLLGFYFYFKQIESHFFDRFLLLPVVLITIFIIVQSVGLGSVCITYAAELFPNDYRPTGVALAVALQQLNLCIVTFSFPLLSEAIGTHWCFWICSTATFIGFISIYYTIPETKGKSFSEIQKVLTK